MTTPKANVLRTVLQAIVAVLVALPIALAKVPIPDKYAGSVALVLGIAAGLVVVISALQNAVEVRVGVVLFRNPTAAGTEPAAWGQLTEPPTDPASKPAAPRGPP